MASFSLDSMALRRIARRIALLPALLVAWTAGAQEPAAAKVDFGRDIRPLLARRCFACHGPDKSESGLRLHRREAAVAVAESGERAIVPGNAKESELLRRITADDDSVRMPPEGAPLTAAQIDLVRRWIAEGATWNEHWSFQPMRPQTPPAARNPAWVRTPVDAFILAKLDAAGLKPAPPAEPLALLRRICFDLTGLPPTPQEVDDFLQSSARNPQSAIEALVDRLLASDRYGERWARHWLDLVRYADTNSFERDGVKPNAWRYRDYVIRSFNADKPYDQFIREQLAGDELPDRSTETIIATGYYRLGLWDDEPADPLQSLYDEFDDIISTTSQVFLGLTVNCARCHDHKIDPIPQRDYYRMLAFFHDLTSYGNRGDQQSANQTDISPPEVAAAHAAHDLQLKELREQMEPIEQRGIVKMPAEDQRKTETREREKVLKEKLKDFLGEQDWSAYSRLKEQYDEVKGEKLPPRAMALSVARTLKKPPETFVFNRGNPHVKKDPVTPGFPEIFESPDPQLPSIAENAKSSGRRTVLANWIASADNRLTSRVIVNRVWQHHFGRGLVRSANNFGQLGDPPTHPELLDWLAGEFVRQGWRLKPLHRMIVLSSAYQMAYRGDEQAARQDPLNNLYWRFDMRRLSGEELRDATYAVTGRLNTKMFGPGTYPEISAEVLAGQSQPGLGWGKSSPEEQARRSVYIHVKRSLITPLLSSFDFPETDSSCEARFVTTQPTQALAMLNGKFLHDRAAELATRLRREAGDKPEDQIRLALRLAFNRPPDEPSVQHGLKRIESLQSKHNLSPDRALDLYCLTVFNLNEFVYLD